MSRGQKLREVERLIPVHGTSITSPITPTPAKQAQCNQSIGTLSNTYFIKNDFLGTAAFHDIFVE
jgi:hypothetical protein